MTSLSMGEEYSGLLDPGARALVSVTAMNNNSCVESVKTMSRSNPDSVNFLTVHHQ